jgi:methionyl-tRNA formyltransferase
MGVDAMMEAIDLVRAGKASRIPQDDSQATYESWCRKADAKIDWSKPAAAVYNLIRGTDPQPGAWTLVGGQEVQIYDSAPGQGSGEPGTVLRVADDSFEVAAQDGSIVVKRVRPQGGKKMDAGAFAKEAGLQQGARLGA